MGSEQTLITAVECDQPLWYNVLPPPYPYEPNKFHRKRNLQLNLARVSFHDVAVENLRCGQIIRYKYGTRMMLENEYEYGIITGAWEKVISIKVSKADISKSALSPNDELGFAKDYGDKYSDCSDWTECSVCYEDVYIPITLNWFFITFRKSTI